MPSNHLYSGQFVKVFLDNAQMQLARMRAVSPDAEERVAVRQDELRAGRVQYQRTLREALDDLHRQVAKEPDALQRARMEHVIRSYEQIIVNVMNSLDRENERRASAEQRIRDLKGGLQADVPNSEANLSYRERMLIRNEANLKSWQLGQERLLSAIHHEPHRQKRELLQFTLQSTEQVIATIHGAIERDKTALESVRSQMPLDLARDGRLPPVPRSKPEFEGDGSSDGSSNSRLEDLQVPKGFRRPQVDATMEHRMELGHW